MAARRVQTPLRQLARSLRSSSDVHEPARRASSAAATTLVGSSSCSSTSRRAFGSAASSTAASSSAGATPDVSSRLSVRGGEARVSPALGMRVTGDQVLSHLSSIGGSSTSDLLAGNAELALRALTHESYLNAREGHNRRLAFVGRRTLKLFTTLWLHARLQQLAKGAPAHTYVAHLLESPSAVDSILSTHRLGDRVGRDLGLENVMRWTPAVADGQLGPRETGLFKVRGVAVEALVGAIYHQAGAMHASHFFHSHILPALLQDGFPGPVPQELRHNITPPAAAP